MSLKNYWFLFLILFIAASCGTQKQGVLRSPSHQKPAAQTNNNTTTKTTTGTSVGHQYIDKYKAVAISEMNLYGIPASIKLAQALLESGNGNSYLAKEANNHFGIKCGGGWGGPSVTRPDDGPNDCFRMYKNPEDSFKDHSQFLLRKRYEKLFTLHRDDYKGWARGLKEAGYATNPRYAELLIDLIERYGLHELDRKESLSTKEIREEKVEKIITQNNKENQSIKTEEIKSAIAMVVYEVKSGDTLYAIAQKYQLSVADLKQLNDLASETIYMGQLLVVSK